MIEISEDAVLHTIIFHLANNNQMSYTFGACGVTFTVWQILYLFAASEECGSTNYKYVLLNNFCKLVTRGLKEKVPDGQWLGYTRKN